MIQGTADTNKKFSAGQCLVVLAKAPERGKVKTRLARDIGKDAAAGLYRAFVSDLLHMLSRTPYPVFIHFWPPEAGSRMRGWLGPGYELIPQSGGDLGERMAAAFSWAFARDFRQAVLIGTDLPDLPAASIHDAFAALEKTPAVLGPSEDGGYFLIGFNRDSFLPAVFSGVNWGTATVLSETAALFEKSRVPVAYIRQWRDIDTYADLLPLARRVAAAARPTAVETLNFLRTRALITEEGERYNCEDETMKPNGAVPRPEISIIIPVFHEAALIFETLEAITALDESHTAEVIVVDGAPGGSTISRLGGYAVETVTSPRGRGLQMNAGARRARGEILLFLHADTRLPQDALQLIKSRLCRPEMAAGAFDLGINSKKPVFRVIEKMANRRCRLTRIPYGDQGIFIKQGIFHALGGYAPIAIMEDIELMRRVKKTGGKITLIGEKAWTSPRRWEKEGIVTCTLRNWLLSTAFYLGVSPENLKRFYP